MPAFPQSTLPARSPRRPDSVDDELVRAELLDLDAEGADGGDRRLRVAGAPETDARASPPRRARR